MVLPVHFGSFLGGWADQFDAKAFGISPTEALALQDHAMTATAFSVTGGTSGLAGLAAGALGGGLRNRGPHLSRQSQRSCRLSSGRLCQRRRRHGFGAGAGLLLALDAEGEGQEVHEAWGPAAALLCRPIGAWDAVLGG
ncbi:hypothetical protein PLESTB_000002100 [Pleodorina starrii]|uniref:Uncharacterized protein n=1 Tax=Pleodorina starrii TaxID=330485 RepID=A0A9W6EWG0_9CHLO|nr:hypothetical protein PLESTB_000001700 [Pleodorina starrii]GLC47564.1 hypothetical protein PLESTB_000001800 [Pleodorina starrii]GLC47565.1 hypothetical protein PLESTB_000001900 [Pleodorina starrii]GLC47566.1 hypothetical protein PLESTB_000002000 [Pleodorina starrii]GLC47567.1 hypothetical protein PLESTB_000002100 [Pleodorina starrii]